MTSQLFSFRSMRLEISPFISNDVETWPVVRPYLSFREREEAGTSVRRRGGSEGDQGDAASVLAVRDACACPLGVNMSVSCFRGFEFHKLTSAHFVVKI